MGSIFHIIAHGLAKTGLFLAAGNFIKEYSSRSIYEFKSAWKRQRMSSLTIIITFSSLMGMPLLAGFNSKYLIKYGFQDGLAFTILLFAASLISSLYSLRFLYLAIFRDIIKNRAERDYSNEQKQILRKAEYLVFIIISILLLITGIRGELIINIVEDIEYNYNLYRVIGEVIVYLLVSAVILWRFKWFEGEPKRPPSLDPLFSRINKGLFSTGRYLYRIIYLDFQLQLLWIPIFIILLFIFVYIQ